jgi:hypothetical protein
MMKRWIGVLQGALIFSVVSAGCLAVGVALVTVFRDLIVGHSVSPFALALGIMVAVGGVIGYFDPPGGL